MTVISHFSSRFAGFQGLIDIVNTPAALIETQGGARAPCLAQLQYLVRRFDELWLNWSIITSQRTPCCLI